LRVLSGKLLLDIFVYLLTCQSVHLMKSCDKLSLSGLDGD